MHGEITRKRLRKLISHIELTMSDYPDDDVPLRGADGALVPKSRENDEPSQ